MKVLICLLLFSAVCWAQYDDYEEAYNDPRGQDFSYPHGGGDQNYGRGEGYGAYGSGNFGPNGYGNAPFRGNTYGGFSGTPGQYGMYKGGGGNPLVMEALYNGPNQQIAGGQFGLGYGGIKSALAPIVNSAYQGNYSPMKRFGFGGFGGHDNHAGGEINDYLVHQGQQPLDPDDLDGDHVPDFLTATKHKIDNYIAKQWLLGRRKLTVSVNYANMPLEYLYLSQYHGFPNPVAGTPLGAKFGLTTKPNKYNNPKKPGVYSKPPQNYMKPLKGGPGGPPPPPPMKNGTPPLMKNGPPPPMGYDEKPGGDKGPENAPPSEKPGNKGYEPEPVPYQPPQQQYNPPPQPQYQQPPQQQYPPPPQQNPQYPNTQNNGQWGQSQQMGGGPMNGQQMGGRNPNGMMGGQMQGGPMGGPMQGQMQGGLMGGPMQGQMQGQMQGGQMKGQMQGGPMQGQMPGGSMGQMGGMNQMGNFQMGGMGMQGMPPQGVQGMGGQMPTPPQPDTSNMDTSPLEEANKQRGDVNTKRKRRAAKNRRK